MKTWLRAVRAALRTLGWVVADLVPAQAIRCAQGRDYDAALRRATPKKTAPADHRGAGSGPAGAGDPPGAPPAGRTQHLAELIAEELTSYADDSGVYLSYERISDASLAVASRIEKATPPAGFTFGDLSRAAQIIDTYCDRMECHGAVMSTERALAERLGDASEADPNP